MAIPRIPVRSIGGAGKFLWMLKGLLIYGYLIFSLVSAILVGIEAQDINVGLKEFGSIIFSPVESAYGHSQGILNGESGHQIAFYLDLVRIIILFLILKMAVDLFLKDSNPPIIRIMITLGAFLMIQVSYLAITGADLNILLKFLGSIWNAIKVSITGFDLTPEVNTVCPEGLCIE